MSNKLSEVWRIKQELRNEKSKYLNAIKRRNVLITQKKNLQKEIN